MKKTHDLNHDLTFYAHTFNCVCHSIRSMFRVLGIYNFGFCKKNLLGSFLPLVFVFRININFITKTSSKDFHFYHEKGNPLQENGKTSKIKLDY